MNTNQMHFNSPHAERTRFGQPLVNSVFTLGLLVGLSVYDTTYGTTIGNLGFEEVKFPRPVLIGDTLRAVTTVISKRESQSRRDSGIVVFEHRALNQRAEEVASCRRSALMLKKATS